MLRRRKSKTRGRIVAEPARIAITGGPLDWRALAWGTPDQRRAYSALRESEAMDLLAEFTPVLAGTLPLDVHLPGSDLDLICRWREPRVYEDRLRARFGDRPGFTLYVAGRGRERSIVARFRLGDFACEIFGQDRPVSRQFAVRHLIAEERLLRASADPVRDRARIRAHKRAGLTTEAAFARVFGLRGDPFARLLEVSYDSDAELARICRGGRPERARRRDRRNRRGAAQNQIHLRSRAVRPGWVDGGARSLIALRKDL